MSPMTVASPLPPSLYADTARPAPHTPPLSGDRRADVAIVGGGFTGLSAALHLAAKGVDTVLLEANEPGWGASGRNGGQVNPGLKHDPDQVEAGFRPRSGRTHGRLVRQCAERRLRPDPAPPDLLRGACSPAPCAPPSPTSGGKDVQASAEQWIRRGGPVSILNRTEIQAATGTSRYQAAMLDQRGGQLNPLGYASGLAQAAMQQGAAIHGGTKVLQASKTGSSVAPAEPQPVQ